MDEKIPDTLWLVVSLRYLSRATHANTEKAYNTIKLDYKQKSRVGTQCICDLKCVRIHREILWRTKCPEQRPGLQQTAEVCSLLSLVWLHFPWKSVLHGKQRAGNTNGEDMTQLFGHQASGCNPETGSSWCTGRVEMSQTLKKPEDTRGSNQERVRRVSKTNIEEVPCSLCNQN